MKVLYIVAVFIMYCFVGSMDYVDAKMQEKMNDYVYSQEKVSDDYSKSEYIAHVCVGQWEDDQHLNPSCPSLEEYKE